MKPIPENVRERWFIVLLMPLDAKGQGPAHLKDTVEITWEVWNQELETVSSHQFLADAIQHCEKLNEEYYANEP